MDAIAISDHFVVYYGNRVGVIRQKKAVIDPMFQKPDLEEYLQKRKLEVEWQDGIYEELAASSKRSDEPVKVQIKLRIYQLKSDVDVRMKFIAYDELIMKGFGKPRRNNYQSIFEGDTDTADLNQIMERYERDTPPDWNGRLLAISDIIELSDKTGSQFYYIDKKGFKKIDFNESAEPSKPDSEKSKNKAQKENFNLSFLL